MLFAFWAGYELLTSIYFKGFGGVGWLSKQTGWVGVLQGYNLSCFSSQTQLSLRSTTMLAKARCKSIEDFMAESDIQLEKM